MMTSASTIEEQLASLTKAIEGLSKHYHDQDSHISYLMNKSDNDDVSHIKGKQVEENDDEETSTKHQAAETLQTVRDL
ncbi:hypothetical protein ACS0TY_011221 [Phlomoides rotata]